MGYVLLEGDFKVDQIDEVGELLGKRFLAGHLSTIYPKVDAILP